MSAERLSEITVWVCDQCGYWRQEERTGVHQTFDHDDWNGRMVVHELRQAKYMPAPAEGGESHRSEPET